MVFEQRTRGASTHNVPVPRSPPAGAPGKQTLVERLPAATQGAPTLLRNTPVAAGTSDTTGARLPSAPGRRSADLSIDALFGTRRSSAAVLPRVADNPHAVHVVATETGRAPPKFPESKQLGATDVPYRNNTYGLKPAQFHTLDARAEGEISSGAARLRALRRPVDAAVNVYVVQPGEHKIGEEPVDGVNRPRLLTVTESNSALVRQGELEHVADMTLAFDLTFGAAYLAQQSIKDNRYDDIDQDAACNKAWQAFLQAMPADLSRHFGGVTAETINARLLGLYLWAVRLTEERDLRGYHTLKIVNAAYNPQREAWCCELDENTAQIGTIPATEIVRLA